MINSIINKKRNETTREAVKRCHVSGSRTIRGTRAFRIVSYQNWDATTKNVNMINPSRVDLAK